MSILTKISELIKILGENSYISFIGFLIGVISLIYAFYVAKRDRKIKWLQYFTGSSNLIDNGKHLFPRLDVMYDGRKLDNFTITKLSIKNKGTEVIRPEDIARNDPITIRLAADQNIEMLEFTIINVTDKNSNFQLNRTSENSFSISFDFIEPEDSVTIQILHTGRDSQAITISGTVIGAKIPFAIEYESKSKSLDTFMEKSTKRFFHLFMKGSPKKITLFTTLISSLVFIGLTRYFYLHSSTTLSILCAMPSAFFIFYFVTTIFRRTDPEQEAISSEEIINKLIKSLPSDEQEIEN